jgi:hypothetical protein
MATARQSRKTQASLRTTTKEDTDSLAEAKAEDAGWRKGFNGITAVVVATVTK